MSDFSTDLEKALTAQMWMLCGVRKCEPSDAWAAMATTWGEIVKDSRDSSFDGYARAALIICDRHAQSESGFEDVGARRGEYT